MKKFKKLLFNFGLLLPLTEICFFKINCNLVQLNKINSIKKRQENCFHEFIAKKNYNVQSTKNKTLTQLCKENDGLDETRILAWIEEKIKNKK